MRKSPVPLRRDANGVIHIEAQTEADVYRGLGYAHALDRSLQMLFMRIVGRGEVSKHLDGSDDALEADRFLRRMGWRPDPDAPMDLSPRAQKVCEAYCEGVNARLQRKVPWELKALGYDPEPWTVQDTMLLARVTGYLTLAQSQTEMEHLIVQMVQAGVSRDHLEALFPGKLGGLDLDLLKQVRVAERFVPEEVAWIADRARMSASNNWTVAGSRTADGHALLASDPHLEINRLPAVWYEVVATTPQRWTIASTMPGLPVFIIGRTPDLAWGPTYAFMDATDSWVEQVEDGKYRRGDTWVPFERRRETIERKGKPRVEQTFYENDHGVLEGDPFDPGFLLCTRWSGARSGVQSIEAAVQLWDAKSVDEGMALLGQFEGAFSWVLADRTGRVGYQMSGLMPLRRDGWSGLVPVPGWDPDNDWRGFATPEQLPRCVDPEQGFFATANQDLNHLGELDPITIDQGHYRATQIDNTLRAKDRVTLEDCFALHKDLYSLQAEQFMKLARPLLPDTPQGRCLQEWDLRYDAGSKGAFLFDRFYSALLMQVITPVLGAEVGRYLQDETGIMADFFINFDRVLLAEDSVWFGGRSREAIYRAALTEALAAEPKAWGATRQLTFSHLLFGEKVPRFAGFDRGPIQLEGGRATVHQGQIFRSGGRTTSFAPSVRFVTSFSQSTAHTRLVGGPSDRRFSRWYCSELEGWLAGTYKVLEP